MNQYNDFFKYLIPLIIFVLGVLFAPFIESRKEKAKAIRIYNSLIVEIEDELKELPSKLIKMAEVFSSIMRLKNYQPERGDTIKYVPRGVFLYFTKQVMDSSFLILNKHQRNAMRSMLVQIDAINGHLKDIKDIEVTEEKIDEVINNYKRYLYTGSCMLYTMRIFVNKTKPVPDKSDEDIINDIFNELQLNISFDDIRIIRTETFRGEDKQAAH